MKWMFLILGVYLLGLSCLPCTDNSQKHTAYQEVTISKKVPDQQDDFSKEACTPFCSCSCCATMICFMSGTKIQPLRLMFDSDKNTHYNAYFTSGALYSVWQPPRLS